LLAGSREVFMNGEVNVSLNDLNGMAVLGMYAPRPWGA
jgi:hypothetical protein